MATPVEQTTAEHKWKALALDKTVKASLDEASLTSGGQFSRATSIGAKRLGELFNEPSDNGRLPNIVLINSWLECASTAAGTTLSGVSWNFRVDAYRQNGYLERMCLVSATTGSYRLSARPDGTQTGIGNTDGNLGSARYNDTLVLTKDYVGVGTQDGEGDNGQAVLSFDMKGRGLIAANIVSTLPAGVKAGFGITGL